MLQIMQHGNLFYDADVARRNEAGFRELAVGTRADNPNSVYIIWDGDPAVMEQMMQDPDLKAKMEEAGLRVYQR